MRLLIIITSAILAWGAAETIAPSLAVADAIPAQVGGNARVKPISTRTPHSDRVASSGTGMALLFWAFAAATIGGALFVITRRNLIAAVMGMVGSFLGIAAVYMMLYAHFLSVVQMLVYAG